MEQAVDCLLDQLVQLGGHPAHVKLPVVQRRCKPNVVNVHAVVRCFRHLVPSVLLENPAAVPMPASSATVALGRGPLYLGAKKNIHSLMAN